MQPETVAHPLTGMTMLVVDDDSGIRSLIGMTLASEGVDVRTAQNGAVALEIVTAGVGFDLIILDLNMPVMDGRTLYRELREMYDETPVLLLSAHGAMRARLELGAHYAMDKPFEPAELVRHVAEIVGA